MIRTKVLVVGVGSRMRGDDMAGPFTIDLLKEKLGSGEVPDGFELELIDADVMPENFTKPMRESGADLILFIDAVDMGLEPGALRIVPRELIDATIPCSHNLPMSYVMGYVNEKVERVELLGVQIRTAGLFEDVTKEVREGCSRLAETIMSGKVLDIAVYSKDEKGSDDKATNYCW
ncbi:MAG: hydrogenase maturation protease [Candidatus Thermoplasmatota archaeon]|nr:hydrogenase maturation protease [Candidatus Thermoplasmatota archaeon]